MNAMALNTEPPGPTVVWSSTERPAGWMLSKALRGGEPSAFRIVGRFDLATGRLEHLFCEGLAPDAMGVEAWHRITHSENEAAVLRAGLLAVAQVARALDQVGEIIASNGCECDCDHHPEEHDDDCERCLGCRISDVIFKAVPR